MHVIPRRRSRLPDVIAGLAALLLAACDRDPSERTAGRGQKSETAVVARSFPRERAFSIAPDTQARALDAIAAVSTDTLREVPFASLRLGSTQVRLLLDAKTVRATIIRDETRTVAFPKPGVPVALASMPGDGLLAIFRSFPENRLEALVFDSAGTFLSHRSFGRQDDGYLFFRALHQDAGRIVIVLYDNRSRQNRLLSFSLARTGIEGPDLDLVLPSLEDPAGGNYEMEPPVFLLPDATGGLRILAGTLDARLGQQGAFSVSRRPECVRIIEAVQVRGRVATLCDLKVASANAVYRIQTDTGLIRDFGAKDGIPWGLRVSESGDLAWSIAVTPPQRGELLAFDLSRAQNSGLLELGSNNVEGRIPWSQIYYLNGLIDLLIVAARDDYWYETYGPLLPLVRERVALELAILDRVLSSAPGFRTRAFTVGRVPALFAVQTIRLLGLLERYANEVPGAVPSIHLSHWRRAVFELRGHIEIVRSGGESDRWIAPGVRYLAWPKGSAFPFDGLPVPFNHQNEWAWSLFETARVDPAWANHPSLLIGEDVIRIFQKHVLTDQRFPGDGRWPYWWGRAAEGWTAADGVSVNTPSYPGDKGSAWISFRTIDLFGVLAALPFMHDLDARPVLDSASELVARGLVYPFAAAALARHDRFPLLEPAIAAKYARSASPSDLASAVWALGRPVDLH